jgi:hypothetical protein
MSKTLPVVYPEIASYPGIANIFSVIGINERTIPWISDHFIQLIAPEKEFGNYVLRAGFYDSVFPYHTAVIV